MTKDRTAYWREYDRKRRDRRKAGDAASRARIAAGAQCAEAPRKVSAARVARPKDDEDAAEAFRSLKERFMAFRNNKNGGSNE
tara:strand:- start:1648 stop:1896 length:249 start_codon:yes stop_codon:yes gene_type:complete